MNQRGLRRTISLYEDAMEEVIKDMVETTRLCPNCRTITKPCLYRVDDGQHTKVERKLYTYQRHYIGKMNYCPKCGTLVVVDL